MSILLAVDAGGTSTRAAIVDTEGRALGYGRAGRGNPTSAGVADAVAAVGEAAARAGVGLGDQERSTATIAMAGEQSPAFVAEVTERLGLLGWPGVHLRPDLLGIFGSGTHQSEGYALIAGTGSVAARVVEGQLDRVVGGRGWLLGDAGSGFWIGHRAVRAVVAAVDGQQPPTALTDPVLAQLGIEGGSGAPADRSRVLKQMVSELYRWRPVQLAAFAPTAFALHDDPTARAILVAASRALAELIAAVRVPELPGPVVVGGSVGVHGFLAAPPELRRHLVPLAPDIEVVSVPDGVVGAAVLGLRSAGVAVDAGLFATVRRELTRAAQSPRSSS